MKYSVFTTQLTDGGKIEVPAFIIEKLGLDKDDYIEVTIKKIKTKKSRLILQKNPLLKLIGDK